MKSFVLSIFCKEGAHHGFRHILFNKQATLDPSKKWELADKFFPSIQAALSVSAVRVDKTRHVLGQVLSFGVDFPLTTVVFCHAVANYFLSSYLSL